MIEKNLKKKYIYIYICMRVCVYLNHLVVHLKLTQHYKLTVL